MRDYSPKRRTAVIFAGSGTSGAYHAGVLKALDESGVKIDLLVGSGVGALAAAFGAAAGGPKLYGEGGFWDGAGFRDLYRLRPVLRIALLLLAMSFGVFLLPVILAILAGLLFPAFLIVDMVAPGLPSSLAGDLWAAPDVLRGPYLAALSVPIFGLSVVAAAFLGRALVRDRRRFGEELEAVLDAEPGRVRLRRSLWEVVRGPALGLAEPSEAELGRRYVGLIVENLGQPGFREVILRAADLDAGGGLAFAVLQDRYRAGFAAARTGNGRARAEAAARAVDLQAPGYERLLFDALSTGLLPPVAAPLRRIHFPKGGRHAGETHRLTDATLTAACGISEALAAGAEQILVVSAVPERPSPSPRRRGPRALADGLLASLERRGVEHDVGGAERINRMVETLGHETPGGGRAWQDPADCRLYRDVALFVVRPERRRLGPLELDGACDPATEVLETTADLMERGRRDAYRLFVEPVVGAEPRPAEVPRADDRLPHAVEL
jgi:hypothetical protein